MPSETKKQEKTMRAACKSPDFSKKVGIPKKVSCEFHEADKRKKRGKRRGGRSKA